MQATAVSHFYLGRVADLSRFTQFLTESYNEDDHPISEFFASQGEIFCDHDWMETGIRHPGTSLEEFFAPYSYAEEWSTRLSQAAILRNLNDANILIFIDRDQVSVPRSVKLDELELEYMGTFEYKI